MAKGYGKGVWKRVCEWAAERGCREGYGERYVRSRAVVWMVREGKRRGEARDNTLFPLYTLWGKGCRENRVECRN